MNQIIEINFHDQNLIAVEQNGEVFVSVKRICFNLGLDWSSQLRNIKHNPILSEGMVVMTIPTKGGIQEVSCLPLSLINGWLFKIDVTRIKDLDIQNKILKYQRECYKVLHQHFHKLHNQDVTLKIDSKFLRQIVDVMERQENDLKEKQAIIEKQNQTLMLFDDLKNSKGNLCLQDAAKALHLKPNLFIAKLQEKGYLIKNNKKILPMQSYLNKGIFVTRSFTVPTRNSYGALEQVNTVQTLITPKGLDYFRSRILDEFKDVMNDIEKVKFGSVMIAV
jgi:phage antirepressor YoqD-like protein